MLIIHSIEGLYYACLPFSTAVRNDVIKLLVSILKSILITWASYVRFKGKQSDNNAGDKYRTKQNEGW